MDSSNTRISLLQRLSTRLALWVIFIALGLGVLFSALQISLDYFQVQEEFDSTTWQVLSTLRKPATEAAYQLDERLADEVLQGLSKYSSMYKALLSDDHEQMLGEFERELSNDRWRWLSALIFGAERQYNVALIMDDKLYGTLDVYVDTHILATGFLERSGIVLLSSLTRNLLLATIIFFLFQGLVNRPLSHMASDLAKIDPERPEKTQFPYPKRHEKDELGQLTKATNDLLKTIDDKVSEREALLNEMREAKQAAESANVAKSQFIAKMSHELRTPLNAVIGYSEMLQDEVEDMEPDEIRDDLQQVLQAGQQLLAMVNDVLDISKIESGEIEFHHSVFSVNLLAKEICQTITPYVEKTSNTMTCHLDDEVGSINADMGKIKQSLLNLLNNACKYTENGHIELRIERSSKEDGDWLHFTVSDTGIGIPKDQQQAIFASFDQADNSYTRAYDGMGLGLAISHNYATMMGGRLTVESEPGKGSEFTLHIPVEPPGETE